MKTYRVVSFTPQFTGGVFSAKGEPIAQQLENVIKKEAADGWEFISYQSVHGVVNPGCLAGLIGRKQEIVYYDVLIFSK